MGLLRCTVLLFLITLAGCASNQSAPVIERAPAAKPASASKSAQNKDWRPATHTVKKGDTLFSIGLQYGYDYKEIAQLNNIAPPYIIHIGQTLRLQGTNEVTSPPAAATDLGTSASGSESEDVVITPLNLDGTAPAQAAPGEGATPAATPPETSAAGPAEVPLLSGPKALREPYSEAALAAPPPQEATSSTPTTAKAEPSPPAAPDTGNTKPAAVPSATSSTDGIEWSWPASGKVIAGFSDSNNAKGMDIAGEKGQAVLAAATGKVIYSGSDLRGYGKLVIIKHDKTYLSVYAHNSQIVVKEGQQVKKGQKIAEMGSSDTDKVKLHFEIRQQGKSVDPAKFLPASPS